jgi:hypothetical protein
MRKNRIAVLVFSLGSLLGCSVHGQTTSSPTTAGGPTTFANNQNGIDFGEAAIVPDNNDVVTGYERQAGSQMHFRLSRAYCDKRSTSQQSSADQANFFCVPDAVTIDDTHPTESTPNKNFVIVPYFYGMNIDYPGGIEINSQFVGFHPNHTGCVTSAPWIAQDSCQSGGNVWAEDNDDAGGVFASAYDVFGNGVIDRSQSFSLIASDTYQHNSHGDMLFAVRDPNDNFRFQFGNTSGGGTDPGTYKSFTKARIDSTGKGFFDGGTQVGGADFAESVNAAGTKANYEPGDVLVIDTGSNRQFSLSSAPYSTLVSGIYSTQPGVVGALHRSEDPQLAAEIPMAMVGIVPCKVSAENGPISRGDLLVTSSTPGYAMRGTDQARLPGAVVGKALQPLPAGKGKIEVLVTLR